MNVLLKYLIYKGETELHIFPAWMLMQAGLESITPSFGDKLPSNLTTRLRKDRRVQLSLRYLRKHALV